MQQPQPEGRRRSNKTSDTHTSNNNHTHSANDLEIAGGWSGRPPAGAAQPSEGRREVKRHTNNTRNDEEHGGEQQGKRTGRGGVGGGSLTLSLRSFVSCVVVAWSMPSRPPSSRAFRCTPLSVLTATSICNTRPAVNSFSVPRAPTRSIRTRRIRPDAPDAAVCSPIRHVRTSNSTQSRRVSSEQIECKTKCSLADSFCCV